MDAITDPSDFSSTSLPQLADLDSNLRCQVCKEIFDTPMLTSCSHTFCSKCIRQCLSSDGRCPTCRAEDQPTRLRKNGIVQSLLQSWQVVRPGILEAVRKQAEEATQTQFSRSKRKLSPKSAIDPRYPKRATRSSVKTEDSPGITISDTDDEVVQINQTEFEMPVPDGLVSCPICGTRMKEEHVYGHLDNCQQKPVFPTQRIPKLQNNREAQSPQQHLPFLNFRLMKPSELTKKFAQLGLNTKGTTRVLENRYTYWVNLWNSNCDSDNPRTKAQLLEDLNTWERTQNISNSINDVVTKKDFARDQWSKGHDTHFQDLIAKARTNAKKKKKETQESSDTGPINTVSSIRVEDVPAAIMFKEAASHISDTNRENSLYGSRNPSLKPNSSTGSMGSPSNNPVRSKHMFSMSEEPVKDTDSSLK